MHAHTHTCPNLDGVRGESVLDVNYKCALLLFTDKCTVAQNTRVTGESGQLVIISHTYTQNVRQGRGLVILT